MNGLTWSPPMVNPRLARAGAPDGRMKGWRDGEETVRTIWRLAAELCAIVGWHSIDPIIETCLPNSERLSASNLGSPSPITDQANMR
jgi:hypothetical protein